MFGNTFLHNLTRLKSYIGRPRLIIQTKAVDLQEGDFCRNPIFLIGTHRSGTSLIRRIFNSHPQIACPPESFFISHYASMLGDDLVGNGYEAFGRSPEEMRVDLARKASSLHEAYRLAEGKEIWADKTPSYVGSVFGIDDLFNGEARFVLILRHPADVVQSIFSRGWRFEETESDPFRSAAVYVKQCLDTLLAFEAQRPGKSRRLVYSHLCENPEQALGEVLDFLGYEFSGEMLNFHEKNHNYGLEDPIVRGMKKIQFSGGFWKKWGKKEVDDFCEIFKVDSVDSQYW